MSYLKSSYLLSDADIPPFVLGAFISRSILKDNLIYTEASFKKGKYSNIDFKEYKKVYLDKLNAVSAPFVWTLVQTSDKIFKARLILENDLNLEKSRFFYKLYYKTITSCDWILSNELNDKKKDFIRGFIEPRGSIDTTAAYIPQDYYSDDAFEAKKYKLLTDYCNVPYYVINLNFRDLQKQYYEGTNPRNTQFRVNSKWYMKNIGMYNDYKIDVFANSHSVHTKIVRDSLISYFNIAEPRYRLNNGVDDRFNFYAHNILNKNLSEQEISSLRQTLGYDSENEQIRDSGLAEMVRLLKPDECVCCKNKYNIMDRTFIHKKTNRPYFEVHHVISLGGNKELDDEDNLVKVCPACHSCLKRGTGLEEDQKKLIRHILENAEEALQFCKNMLDCDDIDTLVEKVYSHLK